MNENLLNQAQMNNPFSSCEFHQLDLESSEWELPKPANLIFCLGVFSTLHDYAKVMVTLKKFYSALADDGFLVTRDSLSIGKTFTSSYDNGYYACYRSAQHYGMMFNKAGFNKKKLIPIKTAGELRIGFHIFDKKKNTTNSGQ